MSAGVDCLFCKIVAGQLPCDQVYEDDDAELIGHLFVANRRITRQLKLANSGYRTVFNCRDDGVQLVFHIHLHVLAGRRMTWPPG